MTYCTSCGSAIPEGQGGSCSMCYGDVGYGSDGYYAEWMREQERQEEIRREREAEYQREMREDAFGERG